MNQDTRALIVQLCSCAGAMMEDVSVPTMTMDGMPESDVPTVLGKVIKQSRQISALLTAAGALAECPTA